MTRKERIEAIFSDFEDVCSVALETQKLFFRKIKKQLKDTGDLSDEQIELAEHLIGLNQKFSARWREDLGKVPGVPWDDPDPIDNSGWGGPDSETDQDEEH